MARVLRIRGPLTRKREGFRRPDLDQVGGNSLRNDPVPGPNTFQDRITQGQSIPAKRTGRPKFIVSDGFRGYHFFGEVGPTCDAHVSRSRRRNRPQPKSVGRLRRRERAPWGWVRLAEKVEPLLTETHSSLSRKPIAGLLLGGDHVPSRRGSPGRGRGPSGPPPVATALALPAPMNCVFKPDAPSWN